MLSSSISAVLWRSFGFKFIYSCSSQFPDETEVSRKSMVRNNEGIWIRAPSWYRSVSPFPCRLSRKFQACLFLLKGCYTSLTKTNTLYLKVRL